MPNEVLGIISNRIINEVRGINRVVYDGRRGSKVRVRAHIEEFDKKTLVIKDVPRRV